MRIALVAPFGLRAKGTARARALPLGKALVRRGHTVALFVPPYDNPEDSGQCRTDDGVEVVNVALPQLGANTPPWHFWLGWRLLQASRVWRPDVVHAFKPKGPSGLVGMALQAGPFTARRGDGYPVPLVMDSDDWEGPGGWNDDPRAGYSPAMRRFFAWQERYGLSHAAAWTVASHCLAERAAGFGADPSRVYLLPNGLSEGGLGMAACSLPTLDPGAAPAALLYTRFAGVRVDDAAAVWRRVVVACPAARLYVVGQGLGGEERSLAAAAPNVEVVGWLEPAQMPALFGPMSVALAPWADTPANRARNSAKILELMAAGVPVVAYAVGELPATLGETGLLVPPGDAGAFAAAVVSLLADRTRGRQMGAAARSRVLAEYTWDRLAALALAAYEQAAQGEPHPRPLS
jgi:glycosyltransferase involved in cell wall biosynthesis